MAVIRLPSYTMECGCKFNGTTGQYAYCSAHGKVVKTGEDRARFGQRNREEISEPFKQERTRPPKHSLTRRVLDEIGHLQLRQVTLMTEPQEWNRVDEVIQVARQQITDDEGGYVHARVGRQKIDPLTFIEEMEELYPRLTPEQIALSEGVGEFVEMVTPTQKEVLRYLYWSRLSERDAASVMGISRDTVRYHAKLSYKKLKKAMLEKWPLEGGDESAGPGEDLHLTGNSEERRCDSAVH